MVASFKNRLVRHIEVNGPLPLGEFMHWAMSDPKQGYYATNKPIGMDGDFITAPEISQMFGELLGVFAINTWQAMGSPDSFNLVEIGPGRGTLMRDLLNAAMTKPDFLHAAHISLVETSESLITQQKESLARYDKIQWLNSIDEVIKKPTIIIANELLDVLPIRQYIKAEGNWHERAVGLDENLDLTWTLTNATLHEALLPQDHNEEPEGAVFEISSARKAFIENIVSHLKNLDGVALFIDYGHVKTGFGDTLQAIRKHQYVDVLDDPATADITSHVDFAALLEVAKASSMQTYPLMTQGEFLLALGLLERAGSLGQNQSDKIQQRITKEAERLALPDQMGDLFKAFAFSTRNLKLFPFMDA